MLQQSKLPHDNLAFLFPPVMVVAAARVEDRYSAFRVDEHARTGGR